MNFGSTAAAARVINIMEKREGESEGEIVKKRLNAPISRLAPSFPTLTPLPIRICHETFSGAKCDSRVRNSSPLFPFFPLPTGNL